MMRSTGGRAGWGRWRPRLLAVLRWGTVAALSLLLLLDWAFPPPLPRSRDASTLVRAADGTPLRAFADAEGVWRYPASPDSVSPLYLQALLAYEDRWFWKHPGVNPWALLRAGGQWLRHGHIVSGGSTLTMQVARILDRHGRTPWGKLKQLLRAVQLEVHLTKPQILTLYLERAPYGGTIEGVEAASWAYLGKPAARLSHAEAALLAVLPQSPSRLRPDRHPEAARQARDKVLQRMATLGVWTPAEVADARIEPVVARSLKTPVSAALLAQRLHQHQHQQQPGLTNITTTLDAALQRTLEERVSAYFSDLPERTSAALLVVDNASMQARAYIGSVAFGDKARLGHVDMVQAWRSPGSTLKPFLYGLAVEDGLIHSESLLMDAPQDFGGYRPGNFDAAFNGPVSAADALRLSLNVPAVDLLDRVGPARFSSRLAHAGLVLRYPRGSGPNLSLILGGTGARLEDLVSLFASLNRGGVAARVRYTPSEPLHSRRLLAEGPSWMVREILEAHPRPGYGNGTFDIANRPRVAWKTGTSYGYRDAWALGTTRTHTVGVWVGRPDGTPLPGQYGALTALPLMFEVIDSLPRGRADAGAAQMPADVARMDICWPSGLAAVEGVDDHLCPRRRDAWTWQGLVPPTLPERGSRLWAAGIEQFDVDVDTGERLGPSCQRPHRRATRQLVRWPSLAAPWLSNQERMASRLPPLATDCPDDGRDAVETLQIQGVNDRATLAAAPGSGKGIPLQVRVLGTAHRVQWLQDGRWIAQTQGAAYFTRDFNQPGTHTLTALADSGAWTSIRYRVLP